jgi:hypothetical protein
MKRLQMPFLCFIGGFAVKGVAVVVYDRVFHPPGLLRFLTIYDPFGLKFANTALPLFHLRGIAPGIGSSTFRTIAVPRVCVPMPCDRNCPQ